MKIIFLIIFILIITSQAIGQSSIVYDVGTEISVGSFADICADEVIINGIYSGGGTLYDGPLPVELSSFNASTINNTIKLIWRTETEINNYGFEIERKISDNWEKLGIVQGQGTSNSPKDYSFVDAKPYGGSNFKYRLKQIDNDGQFEYSDIVEINIIPSEFALYQNYPNPFNPSTKIKYQLPLECKVLIKIYDLLGAEIQELLNESKEPGIYEIEFNAANLPSGIYIYRISAGNYLNTKKMILLR